MDNYGDKPRGYTKKRLNAVRDRIKRELPHLRVEDWQDYGFKLTACLLRDGEPIAAWTIFQPERRDIGQPRVSPTDQQIEEWIAMHKLDTAPDTEVVPAVDNLK